MTFEEAQELVMSHIRARKWDRRYEKEVWYE